MSRELEIYLDETREIKDPQDLERYLDKNLARPKNYSFNELLNLGLETGLSLAKPLGADNLSDAKVLFERQAFCGARELVVVTSLMQLRLAGLSAFVIEAYISPLLNDNNMAIFTPEKWKRMQTVSGSDFKPTKF